MASAVSGSKEESISSVVITRRSSKVLRPALISLLLKEGEPSCKFFKSAFLASSTWRPSVMICLSCFIQSSMQDASQVGFCMPQNSFTLTAHLRKQQIASKSFVKLLESLQTS